MSKEYIDLRDLDKEEQKIWKKALKAAGYNFNYLVKNEPVLISDDYFPEYAQEYAEGIGAVDCNQQWPLNHIDWDEAADELKGDYNSIEMDGNTYWFKNN